MMPTPTIDMITNRAASSGRRFSTAVPVLSWARQKWARVRNERQITRLSNQKARASVAPPLGEGLMGQDLTDRLAALDAEIAELRARFR